MKNRTFIRISIVDALKMDVIHAIIWYRKYESVYRTSLNISPSPHPLDLSFSGNLHWLHGSVVHWKLLHGVLHTFVCTVSPHGRPPLVALRSICGPKTRAPQKRLIDDNAITDWHVGPGFVSLYGDYVLAYYLCENLIFDACILRVVCFESKPRCAYFRKNLDSRSTDTFWPPVPVKRYDKNRIYFDFSSFTVKILYCDIILPNP